MAVRVMRALIAVALVASGVLFQVSSWQRWSGYCLWGPQKQPWRCDERMDHRYEVVFVGGQWEPIGSASELAGVGLLLVASALLLLPWVLIEGRPGLWLVTAAGVAALIVTNVGLATLRSGLTREVVEPAAGGWDVFTHLLAVPTAVLIWLANPGPGMVARGRSPVGPRLAAGRTPVLRERTL